MVKIAVRKLLDVKAVIADKDGKAIVAVEGMVITIVILMADENKLVLAEAMAIKFEVLALFVIDEECKFSVDKTVVAESEKSN